MTTCSPHNPNTITHCRLIGFFSKSTAGNSFLTYLVNIYSEAIKVCVSEIKILAFKIRLTSTNLWAHWQRSLRVGGKWKCDIIGPPFLLLLIRIARGWPRNSFLAPCSACVASALKVLASSVSQGPFQFWNPMIYVLV